MRIRVGVPVFVAGGCMHVVMGTLRVAGVAQRPSARAQMDGCDARGTEQTAVFIPLLSRSCSSGCQVRAGKR